MLGSVLGYLLPAEFAAVALAAAGLAFIVGWRSLARLLLVAVAVCLFVAPLAGAVLDALPAPLALLVRLVSLILVIGTMTRLLLGRHVCEMVMAQLVSSAVIATAGALWRSPLVRTAGAGALGGLAIWLLTIAH